MVILKNNSKIIVVGKIIPNLRSIQKTIYDPFFIKKKWSFQIAKNEKSCLKDTISTNKIRSWESSLEKTFSPKIKKLSNLKSSLEEMISTKNLK